MALLTQAEKERRAREKAIREKARLSRLEDREVEDAVGTLTTWRQSALPTPRSASASG